MHDTARKMSKIIDELIYFFFSVGSNGVQMNMKRMDDGYVLSLKSDYNPANRKEINDLEKFLNVKEKNEGLEEFFWQLAGVSNTGHDSEIHLIGQMVDLLKLDISDEFVEMVIYKRKDKR